MTYQVVSLISMERARAGGRAGRGVRSPPEKKNVLLVQLLAKISSRSESRARFRQQKGGARAGLGHVHGAPTVRTNAASFLAHTDRYIYIRAGNVPGHVQGARKPTHPSA
jgi:hypothetical protein